MRTEDVWLIATLATTLPLLAISALGWWRASRRAIDLERRLLNDPTRDDTSQRLEQMVEHLAAQVDELSSGQDFFQRVLTRQLERPGQPPVESPKEVTPH